MIISGNLMLPDDGRKLRLSKGWLKLEGAKIIEVHEGECAAGSDLGDEDAVIMPGFIDTHMHLPQINSIGAYGMELLEWLDTVIFPAESRWDDVNVAEQMTNEAVDRMLAGGTTGFAAYATVHHHSVVKALETAARRNVKAIIGQVLMDRSCPDNFIREPSQSLSETENLLKAWPQSETQRVCTAVTPRFAISCSPELLKGAGRLAQQYQAYVQTHLSESRPECEEAVAIHNADSYTDIYRESDLLTDKTLLGHCIWLDEAERSTIKETSAIAAHCPTANLFLNSGTMNFGLYKREGMRISLGSDIGAGYDFSMPNVARAMVEAAAYLKEDIITAEEAWWQITRGNAEALSWSDSGVIEQGATADLLLLRPDTSWQDVEYPLSKLLFSWNSKWIDSVILNGAEYK